MASVTTTSRLAQPSERSVLRRCFAYLKPHWKLTVGAYLFGLFIDILSMANPQFLRLAIDQGIHGNDRRALMIFVGALLGVTLIKGLLTFFQGRWTEVASQNVAYDIRNELQRKLTSLSFSYHDKSESGDLLSRAIQDVERIRFLTGRATFRIFDSVVLLLATAGVMLWMNWRLALLAFIAMPLLIDRAIRFGRVYRPLSLVIQKQLGRLTTRVEQSLRGARVVKTFAQEDAEIDRFERENQEWFTLSNRGSRMQSVNMPMLHMIANVGSILILWFGGRMVIQGQLTLGELVAFTTYLGQLIQPVRFLGMVLPAISQAESSAERVFEILDTVPDVREADHAMPFEITRGEVRFEDVSFAYSKRAEVLKNISFDAQPNQVIALLGPTGSGKTTVVNLIPRFYDVTGGHILVDGMDVRDITLSSLRNQIGMVLQETTLFAASIRENITFGRPDASEEELIAAAQAAQAHDFIMRAPRAYDSEVGERGVTLSGGQKQRIAIARALLTDPRILVLDDATSSVDTETEHLIQLALDRLMHGRTTFVIAHRLSTVQRADLILLLEKGRIVARGRHDELLRSSRLYNDIYHRQLKPDTV